MAEYDPRADSSPGTEDLRAHDDDSEDNPGTNPSALIIDTAPSGDFKTCNCGCREQITSKASFKQGHDQRLVGKLVRAGRAKVEVCLADGGSLLHTDALGAASHLLNDAGAAKVATGLSLVAKPRKARAKAAAVEAGKVEVELGTVKVGRWTYPAKRHADGRVDRNDKPNGQGKWIGADTAKFVPAA